MLRKFLSMAILLTGFTQAFTQDSAKKSSTTITGSVDGYYRYNFYNAKDEEATNNLTSFTNSHNSFEIGMASLKIEHTMGKVGAVLDVGFGTRATEFSYAETGILQSVKQAFVYFAPSEHVKFTMGKWGTHVGYEVLDAYLNRNYSMSYMFSYGPFSHTGLKADFTFGNVGFMLGVANPTDMISASFGKKFILGQFSAASSSGKVKGYLNYVGGKDAAETSINQFDLVGLITVSDKFNIGLNGTVQMQKPDVGDSKSWWGAAGYLNYDPTAGFGLTFRGEYFDDKKDLTSVQTFGTSFFEATLTGNIRIDNLTILPEIRLDNAKDAVFTKNNGDLEKSTFTFILGATYHFNW
jgi:Putative beta-barrel porin-2, OmpL-like. bbp2